MTTRTTNTELLRGGPLRGALNARDMADARRDALMPSRAPVGAAEGLDGPEGDDLAPARGVCLGALLGAMLWCLIVKGWCLVGAAVFAAVGR